MRILLLTVASLLTLPAVAQAANCPATAGTAPLAPTVIAPVAPEFAPTTHPLGVRSGVLSQAYDEAQSVEQVLLRLRAEGCQQVAKVMPAPTAIDPNDPAAYKPKTEFDNTPWRFDMSQNGKRMTADEFSAWMKSRGVRVARGAGAPPVAVAPAIPTQGATGALPAPAAATDGAGLPPGTLPAGNASPAPGQAPASPPAQP